MTSSLFLPVIMGAAVADSLSPCAFSILFLSIAFLFSLGKERGYILKAGGLYILGIASVYTFIGIGILKALSMFSVPNFLGKIGAGLLIIYSVLGLINEIFPSFPIKLKIPEGTHGIMAKIIQKGTMPASFFLGVVVGLFQFPCTGGPYLFVLTLLHGQGTFWSGFGFLLLYNFVFVLPLILMLIAATSRTVLEKVDSLRKTESKKARVILNVVLLIVGLAIVMSL